MSTCNELPIGRPGLEAPPENKAWRELKTHALLFCSSAVTLMIVVPNFIGTHCCGQLTACKSNCKNLATALEMYASDNKGKYPDRLDALIPGNYLKRIPTCPTAGKATYTDYHTFKHRESFRFSCVGNNHAKAYTGFPGSSENIPAYDAEQGLLDHP